MGKYGKILTCVERYGAETATSARNTLGPKCGKIKTYIAEIFVSPN
jgi:hypothetical protein